LLEPTFRNPKHAAQWINSLEQHVPAHIWHKPIADVATAELLEFLQKLYVELPETARRVRMRLDSVFDDAIMRGLCASNPALAIKKTLMKFGGKRKREGFAALPWAKVPALAKQLAATPGAGASALEFALLTASRTGEVLGMDWREVDLHAHTWTVPGERMKGGEPHTVFVSSRAMAILESMQQGAGKGLVFPGAGGEGKPLSNMALLMVLRRLAASDETTVHGLCRVTFSTWANERGYRPDVIEACLAHRERDLVRAAYNRAGFIEERKQLLADWAAFVCGEKQARVASLKEARAR
jgi:integrase